MRGLPSDSYEKIGKKRGRNEEYEMPRNVSKRNYTIPKRAEPVRVESKIAQAPSSTSVSEQDREIAELIQKVTPEETGNLDTEDEVIAYSDVDISARRNPYIRSAEKRRAIQEEIDQESGIGTVTENVERPLPSETLSQVEDEIIVPEAITPEMAQAEVDRWFAEDVEHDTEDLKELEKLRAVNVEEPLEVKEEELNEDELPFIKNRQELAFDGSEPLPQVRNEAVRKVDERVQHALDTLRGAGGWSRGDVDGARSLLLEKGFVRSFLNPELRTYLQGLEDEALQSIDDWPQELFEALREAGFTIGAYEQFANTYELEASSADASFKVQMTPRQAVGFLKSLLGLPERARHPFEVEDAFDDFALPTDPNNQHYKPENIEKVARATEILRKHEIIRDPNWVFDERFQTELGLTERDLRSMEGFKELTLPQQKLIVENAREYHATHPESIAGKIWASIERRFNKDGFVQKESEKQKTIVAALVRNMAEHGPRVHETKEGELVPDLIGLEYHRDHRKEQREASIALNKAAYELSQTPESWRRVDLETEDEGAQRGFFGKVKSLMSRSFNAETLEQQERYAARELAYTEAKHVFAETLRKSGMGESAVIKMLLQIDGKVATLQFLETAPEAVDATKVSNDAKITEEVVRPFNATEAVAYMGLGAISKLALKQTFDWATGPVVASVIGGIKSWRASRKALATRDREARFGTVDTSKEALNVAQAIQEVEVSGEKRDRGVIAKTQSIIDRIHALHGDVTEEGTATRARLLEQLKVRVAYVEEKMRLNQINFGKPREVPNTIARLYETLGEAHVLLADRIDPALSISELRLESLRTLMQERDVTFEKISVAVQEGQVALKEMRDRQDRKDARRTAYFKNREERIKKLRTWYKTREASKGAAKAGAFALLGAGLADLFEYDRQVAEASANGHLDELKTRVREAFATRDIELPTTSASVSEVAPSPESMVSNVDILESVIENDSGAVAEVLNAAYEVQRGDTLTSIARTVPSAIGLTENDLYRALLSLDRAALTEIGIESGSIDKIKSGGMLNLEALNTHLERYTGSR